MEELLNNVNKILSNNISFYLYSYPHFSVELFLTIFLCIVHLLLIFEVNQIFARTNAKAVAKLQIKHPQLEGNNGSIHSIYREDSEIYPRRIEASTTRQSLYIPMSKRLTQRSGTKINFPWMVPKHSSTLFKSQIGDRVKHLLAVTPSEFIKREKQKQVNQAEMKSCIKSLTTLMEKALADNSEFGHSSKEAIRNGIKALKINFENQFEDEFSKCNQFKPNVNSLLVLANLRGGRDEGSDVSLDMDSDFYEDKNFDVVHGDQRVRFERF